MATQHSEISYAYRLFEGMQKDNLSYIYRGVFSQNITDGILTLTESNLDKSGEDSKIKKRVFTIMVEGLQNITRHQEMEESSDVKETGIFLIQDVDNRYYITTGNPILKRNIPNLTEQLNKINSLDNEELKNYYKRVLNDNIISDKGGAGLGLIEMARKSGNKLVYDFVDLNENYSYFYLNTEISQNETDHSPEVHKATSALENIKVIHRLLNQEDVVLIFNGIFNQESLLNLLSIMENQMMEHNLNLKKKVFNIMVEMLQNIVKHGANSLGNNLNPGIFFINQKGKQYHLNTGNYIYKNDVENLKKKINYVNSLTMDELNEFYEKSLFNFQIDTSKEAGLGLIELRLKTNRKLTFEINDFNEKFSFFVLQTVVD
ncbi:MAG: SiaB family protein kinase [Salinivirgaceae bacterium]